MQAEPLPVHTTALSRLGERDKERRKDAFAACTRKRTNGKTNKQGGVSSFNARRGLGIKDRDWHESEMKVKEKLPLAAPFLGSSQPPIHKLTVPDQEGRRPRCPSTRSHVAFRCLKWLLGFMLHCVLALPWRNDAYSCKPPYSAHCVSGCLSMCTWSPDTVLIPCLAVSRCDRRWLLELNGGTPLASCLRQP